MTRRAGVIAAVAACVAGAVLVLLAAAQPWAGATVSGLPGQPTIEPTGSELAPVVPGLGLAVLAGGLAIIATRGLVRVLVGAFLVLAGIGIAAGVVRVATDLDGALYDPAVDAVGHTSPVVTDQRLTGWPIAAVAGGGVVAAAGAAVVLRGRRWPGMSGRYERTDGGPRERPATLWEALSRGDDPTV